MTKLGRETIADAGNGLIDQAGVAEAIALNPDREEVWIEVIQKMEQVYSDLVRYQVELEEKNAALEDAHQFIASVLTSMTDVLLVCDADGRLQRVNFAAEKLIGEREAVMMDRDIASLFSADSVTTVQSFLEQIRSDRVIVDQEVSLLTKEGAPAPLAVNCTARYDHGGRLVGMVLIGRPVGELRRAYEQLDRAHRDLSQAQQHLVFSEKMAALGQLVAGVAHELNNPISFVFGNMHALKRYGEHLTAYLTAMDEGASPERLGELRQTHRIDRILKDIGPLVDGTLEGAERVSEIVQDLRRFSSSQEEPLERFDLTRVVKTATRWVTKSAKSKLRIDFHVPEDLEALGRKGAVHQIVVNLVQNAVDVTADLKDPCIQIACGSDKGDAWVRVQDNGPGIAAENLGKVFDPFFTTKRLGEGTGLGLYVSYGLAEELGGRLSCRNDPERGGAEFTLQLPRGEDHDG